ncbi:MAG: hypothetical protein K5656_11305 [Lachnospiraceae bacterium]|nr:hypothetical protein [Lachnospiraceae bacterium]
MTMIPKEEVVDETSLVEITDSTVLARIDSLIPGMTQAGIAAINAAQASGETLYKAIIPAGAKLTNSKAMNGAVRGIYHGADGIKGHANLVAVNQTASTVANTAAAAMSVASMVVGQYYMTQINAELGEISDGIEKISSFQDNEYKSRVFALMAQIKKIASFQAEIIDNPELRAAEIAHLNKLEDECIQLLGQANLMIADLTKKKDMDFSAYEKQLGYVQSWYVYQQNLLDLLYKISDLKYVLNLGNVSKKQCGALLPTYTKQVSDSQELLSKWHQDSMEKLSVDMDGATRKRDGIDAAINWIPGLFDGKKNYCSISGKTVDMIGMQLSGNNDSRRQKEELYNEDVQIISKGGKVYYLPPTSKVG